MGVGSPHPASEMAARLRDVFAHAGQPMLIVDDARWYVTANSPACALLGLAPEVVPWRQIDDFTPLQDRERLVAQWDAFLTTGAMEGWIHLAGPDGDLVPIELSVTANVLPRRHLMVVIPDPEALHVDAQAEPGWIRLVGRDEHQALLTDREHEVITMVAAGLQGGEIARRLVVSPETVKSHVQNTMVKLGAHTRAHAVAIAIGTGQIEIDEYVD